MKIKKLALDIEEKMNNLTIKKKFYVFYILCVLVPLIITDSVVFHIVRNAEQERQEHEMANIANAVGYSLIDVVEGAAQIAHVGDLHIGPLKHPAALLSRSFCLLYKKPPFPFKNIQDLLKVFYHKIRPLKSKRTRLPACSFCLPHRAERVMMASPQKQERKREKP